MNRIEEIEKSLEMKITKPQIILWDELRPKLWKAICEAQKKNLEKREQLKYPPNDPTIKDTPKLTDFDRQTSLNAAAAEYLYEYELLKGYYDILDNRIRSLHGNQQQ